MGHSQISEIFKIMTCQITSLLREKAITASDSAVTVNNTKSWKNVEKTFKLSDNPPVNIMINGSPTINNFPVQILIHEFEKICKSDDIEEITEEFLEFIGKTVPKTNVNNFIKNRIDEFKLIYGPIDEYNYKLFIEPDYEFNIQIPEYLTQKYDLEFEKMIKINLSKKNKSELIIRLKKIFCNYLISKSTGIVITGISKKEHFPSLISFNIILNNNGKIEILNKKSEINCNKTQFDIFGETDVIDSYLTGIDEDFETILYEIIKNIFNPTNKQLEMFTHEINHLKMIKKKDLLKNIDSLPDENLYELMEILIKSTEMKRKLLSNIDSVGGNVHIEKITKNNGIEVNEKIYKMIKTIKK